MSIAESMSRGYSSKNGVWTYNEEGSQPVIEIIKNLNAPTNQEEALNVVRIEALIRKSEEYLQTTTPYVIKYQTPPIEIDKFAQ